MRKLIKIVKLRHFLIIQIYDKKTMRVALVWVENSALIKKKDMSVWCDIKNIEASAGALRLVKLNFCWWKNVF